MVTTPRILGLRAGLELALVAQQKGEAEGLVEDARKGVRGIKRHRSEERVDLLLEKLDGELAIGFAELLPADEADAGALEFGNEMVVPGGALILDELMEARANAFHALVLGEAASVSELGNAEAFFKALQDACNADLDELIEVASGDGEELDAFEQRIGGVVGFFQDAAVELKPALVAIDEAATWWRCRSFGGTARRGAEEGSFSARFVSGRPCVLRD